MKNSPPLIHCGFFRLQYIGIFKAVMKFSWTSLKISLAGAKLSHLSQKDRIWDHGTMIETVKIVFKHVQKARIDRCMEFAKKYVTIACLEKLQKQFQEKEKIDAGWQKENQVITELGVVSVRRARKNKPDMFTAIIKVYSGISEYETDGQKNKFSQRWSFIREGDWWVLDEVDDKKSIFIIK